MMPIRSRARQLMCALLLAATSAPALAQEGAGDPEARAQALFAEAWRLMDQRRPAEACMLFRRALELKRSPSTLNNVGRCQQQENDLLGAIATFESSVELAQQQPPGPKRNTWLKGAQRELSLLQQQVARLALQLPDMPGLEVEIDGEPLAPGARHVYLLPGRHRLTASAPDRVPHEVELQLSAGTSEEHRVPELRSPAVGPVLAGTGDPAPSAAGSGLQQDWPPPSSQASPRVLPWALIGAGSAVVVGGVITGLLASSKEGELERNCPSDTCPSPDVDPGWQGRIDDTRRMALVTDVLWGVGLAAVGAGVTLLVLEPEGDEPQPEAELQAGCRGSGCGFELRGRF